MAAHPREYLWSSYLCHAEGKFDKLITDHALYYALGQNQEERQTAYQYLFKAYVSEAELIAIRDATNKGWVLGNDRFIEEIAAAVSRRMTPLPKGRPRKESNQRNGV